MKYPNQTSLSPLYMSVFLSASLDRYASWFQDLIIDREKLCGQVTIPQSTYKLYSDPLRVYTPMKQRRLMFIKYLQLEDMGVEDVADIKDFKLDKEI